MATKARKVVYTDTDRALVNALKEANEPLTMAQLAEATGLELKSGHLVSAMHKGLIEKAGEIDVEVRKTKTVATYVYATDQIAVRPSVKEGVAGKPYNYSATELAIIAALKEANAPMTLTQISEAINTPLSSGNINALVNTKHNVNRGEDIDVEGIGYNSVNTYRYLRDIPSDN